jgi:Leucine-rich repeat (LRR) protein
LTGCGVKKFEVGLALSGIEVLVLSFNELAKMDFCSSMPSLRHLDLSYNLLKRIEGLDGLPALTSLLLQGNLVYRLEDVNVLKRHAPDLLHLNLRGNSITDVKNYRSIILRRLVHLRSLDGLPVTTEERLSAGERPSSITWDVLVQYARTRGPLGWSLLGRIESIDSLIPITGSAGVPSSAAEDDEGAASSPVPAVFDLSVLERVQILELTHMRIRKISNLDRLVNLRRLNFCDNEVSRIEGLDSLINLQELNLEENKITKIEGLERCLRLRKLELGKNRISRLEGVSQLRELTLFSVEDNDLNSLVGVQSLLSLMEFYAGNNKISFSRDVAVLKDLPKLIILDLSGNNMCSADADYRLFTIYTLRKLKVLDGVSIDANESQRAKEMFAGRLSTEMLAERLGHTSFGSVTELNLSASSIRDGLNVLEDFVSLRELVLDSNNISDLEPICCLKNLQVLRLARNKIEAGLSSYSAGKCIVGRQLECFHQLEILDLSYNAISYLPALHLHRLTKLRSLLLAGNEIVKVEGLDNLVQLRELILDKNKIRQIDPASFASLINLRELRLEENAIRALDNFRPLVRLQSLNISCNRIMELQEIDKLVDLRSLLEIVMVFNAVARKPMYRPHLLRRLPSLQMIDGREVTYEERERADALYSAQEYNASAAASTGYVGSQSGIQAPMSGYGSMPTAPPAPVNMGYGGLGPQGVPSYLSGPVGVQAQLGVQQSSGQQKLLVKMQSGSMEPDSGNYSQRGSSGPYRLQRGTSADASRVEPTSVPFQVQQPPPAATAGSASVLVVRRAKSNTRNAREGSFRRPR